MKKYEVRQALQAVVPDVPPRFGNALRETLAQLACQEGEGTAPRRPMMRKRRALALALIAVLLLAAVAAAATLLARNVFDVTLGDTPVGAASLTQSNLAREVVENAEITVKEAAYDGMTLYILYGIRDMTATRQLGAEDERGYRYLRQEDYQRIESLGVGWWVDHIWIDGNAVDMPSMSGGDTLPGEEPGEALYYMQYRLDQVELYLEGTHVEIALPIGQRQSLDSLAVSRDPYRVAKPDRGMVTFSMDCSSREQVVTQTPNLPTEGPRWSARVTQVVYSPIQMYVTLEWAVRPEALEAYTAENGDGYYQDGVKLWDYGGLEVAGDEIMSLRLVDAGGKPVFETMQGFYGCGGVGNTQAFYTFPYAPEYPQEMYLAPEIQGKIDMALGIRVK